MPCVFAFLLGSWVFLFIFLKILLILFILYYLFIFIRTHTAYWADCFLELHPPPPSSECMTCVTSTLLMICNDNSSKGSCTKWLMHFIIFTVSAGFQLTLWFVVRWVITCVLLHFCTCGWPFSLWLETFISAICSGHGCMTKEDTFLEPLKGLWVRIKQPV